MNDAGDVVMECEVPYAIYSGTMTVLGPQGRTMQAQLVSTNELRSGD